MEEVSTSNVWYGILAATALFLFVMLLACYRGGRHDDPPNSR